VKLANSHRLGSFLKLQLAHPRLSKFARRNASSPAAVLGQDGRRRLFDPGTDLGLTPPLQPHWLCTKRLVPD
jgi:hypothetical protein